MSIVTQPCDPVGHKARSFENSLQITVRRRWWRRSFYWIIWKTSQKVKLSNQTPFTPIDAFMSFSALLHTSRLLRSSRGERSLVQLLPPCLQQYRSNSLIFRHVFVFIALYQIDCHVGSWKIASLVLLIAVETQKFSRQQLWRCVLAPSWDREFPGSTLHHLREYVVPNEVFETSLA